MSSALCVFMLKGMKDSYPGLCVGSSTLLASHTRINQDRNRCSYCGFLLPGTLLVVFQARLRSIAGGGAKYLQYGYCSSLLIVVKCPMSQIFTGKQRAKDPNARIQDTDKTYVARWYDMTTR